MDSNGWIALIGLAFTGLGFVIGLFKYFTAQINSLRIENEKKLTEAIIQGDEKRARIYERLDETKKNSREDIDKLRKELMDSYVQNKTCELLRHNTTSTIDKIEKQLEDIQEKLDKINDKLNATH